MLRNTLRLWYMFQWQGPCVWLVLWLFAPAVPVRILQWTETGYVFFVINIQNVLSLISTYPSFHGISSMIFLTVLTFIFIYNCLKKITCLQLLCGKNKHLYHVRMHDKTPQIFKIKINLRDICTTQTCLISGLYETIVLCIVNILYIYKRNYINIWSISLILIKWN